MKEIYNMEKNLIDFKDVNDNKFYIQLKGKKTIVGGETATGKTLLVNSIKMLIDNKNIGMTDYIANNVFEVTSDNLDKLSKQKDKLIVIDRADIILDKDTIKIINEDDYNTYLIFARAPIGIYLSPNYFANLVNNNGTIELKYRFNER